MVVDKKVSLLPAPTESDSATGGTEFESRITDKTSFSLPEDGSPITIATRRRRHGKDGLGLNSNKSQTSLLIEYFEGSKSGQMESRRPSVRVKVRPSSKIRSRSSNDRIQISERKSTRKTSYTKQHQFSSNPSNAKPSEIEGDNQSTRSHRSATEESNVSSKGSGSIEVEITPRRHGSPLIPVIDTKLRTIQINPSEISSVPDDSFLDGKVQSSNYRRSLNSDKNLNTFSSSGFKTGKVTDQLEMPLRSRSRSLSRERIVVQKAVEKVRNENSEQRRRKHSSRSRSISSDIVNEPIRPLKKLITPHRKDILASGADSSLLNSHLSAKSGEAYSLRSGTSRSSMNNPKLLETVEDAIRRLILPELSALKREQSRHIHRNHRNSITSCSGHSKDSNEFDLAGKKTDQVTSSDNALRPEGELINSETLSKSSAKWLPDDKHAGYIEDSSTTVYERETIIETVIRESGRLQNIRNQDNQPNLKITEIEDNSPEPLTELIHQNSHESFDQEETKKGLRRRNKSGSSSHSRSNSFSNTYHENNEGNPQMPLLHEMNPSEITRSSILSAPSETINQANKEPLTPLREVSRGVVSPISRTPNRTPVSLQHVLGTQHSNISRGNISLHGQQSEPQLRSATEYDLDEHGQKIVKENLYTYESVKEEFHHQGNLKFHSIQTSDDENAADESPKIEENCNQDTGSAQDKSNYFYQEIQEVPLPLRYVPYSYERRGLSPIQSVSGYTDGEPENKRDSRLTRSSGSYSSIGRHAMQRKSVISTKSLESIGSPQNPYDFPDVRQGGLADSEITQDFEQKEEQCKDEKQNQVEECMSDQCKSSQRLIIENTETTEKVEEHVREPDEISIEESRNEKDFEAENGEQWQRDSLDRKRDTIVTNPYENTSPVTAGDLLDQNLPDFKGFIPSKLSLPEREAASPKNEGYTSPLPNRSPGALTPEPQAIDRDCDPFYTPNHQRNFSGMSHGMSSPLYDSATGNGIDRIESRDIIALMDHLTVRDAQRSARDTEILVTLVRAAAEMRNSFEDMKRLLADTEDVIITEVQTNTEKSVQKVMYGPRPPPQSGRRSLRPGSYQEICEDIPTKKRNVFRRALKGLSMKSANDLGKIEEMLVQLLGEVEGLKVAQGLKPVNHRTDSHDQLYRESHIYEGHEPESNRSFSTVENASPPGHVFRESSRVCTTRTYDIRKNVDHRFSTVLEDDEDYSDSEAKARNAQQSQKNNQPSTPLKEDSQKGKLHPSSPVDANLLNDQHNLPVNTDKSKKHKSGSSSGWIPKVSRWSETTASSVFRGFRSSVRSSIRKADDASPPSRSGSESGYRSENRQSSADKLKFGSSRDQFHHPEGTDPSAPHISPEDPKYKAHRDSKNLQHPQPRLGSTDHHQTTLETQVDHLESQTPPNNSDWDREKNKNQSSMQQRNSYSGNMSPSSDGEYSASNQLPSKASQENLGYDRSMKTHTEPTKPSPLSNENVAEELCDIPRSPPRHLRPLHCIPSRRPTGPRTMVYPQNDCCDQKSI